MIEKMQYRSWRLSSTLLDYFVGFYLRGPTLYILIWNSKKYGLNVKITYRQNS